MRNFDTSEEAVQLNRTQITSMLHKFNARNRARLQIPEHGIPIVGRPITQPERYTGFPPGSTRGGFSPQGAGSAMKQVPEYFIESPNAAESGCQSYFSHRHSRFVNELLGKEHAPGLRHRDGRGSQMLKE